MSEQADLTNHFLIAMPTLEDPNFQQYVPEDWNADGA